MYARRGARRRTISPTARARLFDKDAAISQLLQHEAGRREVGPHDGPDAHRLHVLAGAAARTRCRASTRSRCRSPPRWASRSWRRTARRRRAGWSPHASSRCRRSTRTRDRPTTSTSTIEDRPRSRSRRRRRNRGSSCRPPRARSTKETRLSVSVDWKKAPVGRDIACRSPSPDRRARRPSCRHRSTIPSSPTRDSVSGFVETNGLVVDRRRAFLARGSAHADSTGCASRASGGTLSARDHAHAGHVAERDAGRQLAAARVRPVPVRQRHGAGARLPLADAQLHRFERRAALRDVVRRRAAADRERVGRHARSGRGSAPSPTTFSSRCRRTRSRGRAATCSSSGWSTRASCLQRLVISPRPLPQSYLGPPESFNRWTPTKQIARRRWSPKEARIGDVAPANARTHAAARALRLVRVRGPRQRLQDAHAAPGSVSQSDSRRLLSRSEHHARGRRLLSRHVELRVLPRRPDLPQHGSRALDADRARARSAVAAARGQRGNLARHLRAGDPLPRRHVLHDHHAHRSRRQLHRHGDGSRRARGPIRSGCARSTASIRRSSSTTTAERTS